MQTSVKSSITLKGSAQMIQEYFHYGIHTILYQRGLYSSDSFSREKKYGMTLFVSTDKRLAEFLKPLLENVEALLSSKELKRLVFIIYDVRTKEVLERWQFDITMEEAAGENRQVNKDEKRIKQEISDVIRQITASVAFLPLLEEQCSFDVHIHTKKEAELPEGWADSADCQIKNAEQVQLRYLSTGLHKVGTQVQYKAET